MAFRRVNKVSTAFSMASLTDIIFLLLIFFMLTSGLVSPNALNLYLPGEATAQNPPVRNTDRVAINPDGSFVFNGKPTTLVDLDRRLQAKNAATTTLAIAPAAGTPAEHVVAVMDIALRYNLQSVLAIARK